MIKEEDSQTCSMFLTENYKEQKLANLLIYIYITVYIYIYINHKYLGFN